MADVTLPTPIQDGDLDLTIEQPFFLPLLSSVVGDAGGDGDGYVSLFNEVVDGVSAMENAITAGDVLLDTATAVAGTLDPTQEDADAQAVSDARNAALITIAEMDQELADAGGDPGPPIGPGGGGGGPGGGGGKGLPIGHATQPVLACEAMLGFPVPDPSLTYPISKTQAIQNVGGVDVHLQSITLVQDQGGPFTASDDCSGTLAPGAQCNLTITLEREAPFGTKCQLQIAYDAADSPAVLCAEVGATSSTGGPPGSGEGHPIKHKEP